jgi:spermidine synthase
MRKLLYVSVFFSGMTSLAVEFAASRLLGNYFGTSNLVWASIIGLILIYLTLGYFLGGRWADRSPQFKTFFKILCWAAFTVGLIPIISRPILRIAAQAFDQLRFGVLAGSFVSVMILFCIPITLLGTASPFAIRLAIKDARTAGGVSGRIYAISTIGSFIGTFLPVLILIPLIGTYRTFMVFSSMLLVIALFGLWRTVSWKVALLHFPLLLIVIVLALFGIRGLDKTNPEAIYETESAYNYIQVQEKAGTRYLHLNEGQGYHSVFNPNELVTDGPWDQVIVAPFFNAFPVSLDDVHRLAIVGLAAGTTARQASAVFPSIEIDGFEIDPIIIEVARLYFDMNESQLRVVVQDGRIGLQNSLQHYDIISVDAYRPPYIPPQFTTYEFFCIVKDHLSENGTVVLNVGRSPTDRSLIDHMYSTIRSVFPSAYIWMFPIH